MPNLESKFVAANTLIPVKYDGALVESAPDVRKNKDKLKELNHRIFLAKRNVDKQRLKDEIKATRKALAKAIEDTGFVGHSEAELLAGWDMFEQNVSSSYFDAEWMFGVKGGFDIVIGNPPYVVVKTSVYPSYSWNTDLYKMFLELSLKTLCKGLGIISMITPKFYLLNKDDNNMRVYLMNRYNLLSLATCNPFDAVTENVITIIKVENPTSNLIPYYDYNLETKSFHRQDNLDKEYCKTNKYNEMVIGLPSYIIPILQKMYSIGKSLGEITESKRGAEVSKNFLRENNNGLKTLIGQDMRKYTILWNSTFLPFSHKEYKRLKGFFDNDLIYLRRVDSMLEATFSEQTHFGFNKNVYGIKNRCVSDYYTQYLLGCINSKAADFYYKKKFSTKKTDAFPEIQTYLYEQLPIPSVSKEQQKLVVKLVDCILRSKKVVPETDTSLLEQQIDLLVYHLYGLTYDEVLIVDPDTPITREEYENQK